MKDFFQLRESLLKEKTMELAGVTLQHMEHCPGAVAAFKKNLKDGASEADVAKAAKAVDAYLAIEDKVVKAGKATDADVEKMEDLIDKAEKIIAKLGLEGHTYHDMHLDRVEDMVEEEDDEDDEDEDDDDDVNEETDIRNLSNRHLSTILRNPDHPMHSVANNELSRRRMARESTQIGEKTLTPAEKKKREEIAKAMERENPGMDMSKKMAIATATAKRVAEANKEYGPGHIGAIQKMLDKEREAKKAKAAMKKEEVELDEAAPKIKPDFVKTQREKDRAHDAAMGRTATGRKKPQRAMTSTQRSLASMRKEEVELGEAKLSQQQRDRLDDLILNVHMTTHPEYDGGETPGKYLKAIEKEFGAKVAKQVDDGIEIAHWGRDNRSSGNDKLSWRKGGARITKSGKMNKQDVEALKNRIKRDKQWGGITKKVKLPEEVELGESNLTSDDLHRIAKDHENAAKKHGAAYDETKSGAAARSHEIAWDRHVDAAKAHREAAKDKSKHSREKLEKMSNHAWDATDHIRKHFDESVELDEISDKTKQRYINKAMGDHQHANAVRKDAEATGKSDLAAKMIDRMKKRNKGMTRAFGGERD